jgi:uncharacterized protein (DUF302 family)
MMCRRLVLVASLAFFLGVIAVAVAGVNGVRLAAEPMLLQEVDSPYGFDETVDRIEAAAEAHGWSVPKTYRLCKGLAAHGHSIAPVAVVELCQPDYAARLLQDDATRGVSAFMPCRISVHERSDGSVAITRMNTGLMSRVFSPEISEVMGRATADTQLILAAALDGSAPVSEVSEAL